MNYKKLAAAVVTGLLAVSLVGCGGGDAKKDAGKDAKKADNGVVVLQVAYENNASEPVGLAWEKAKEILKKKSSRQNMRFHC